MSTNTTNYNLVKPADNDTADISVINANMDTIDTAIKSLDSNKEAILKTVTEKSSLVDADSMPLLDSADSTKTKKITFTNVKSTLKTYFDTLYDKTTIANNLTTTTAGSALDAMQGKALSDSISEVRTIEPAGGTSTAITLNTGTLLNGYITTFTATSNNSAIATTINGIPLYKPNSTTAPTLIAGKAYTVWYNSTTPCFFLKASAEGTAVAANVLAGTTFSNDNDTGISGAMANNGAITKTLTASKEQYTIPAGFHNGSGKVIAPKISLSNMDSTIEYITSSQVWTVPNGVTKILYWMCGGGAKGTVLSGTGWTRNVFGGPGGEVKQGILVVKPGDQLQLIVGAGGGNTLINTITVRAPSVNYDMGMYIGSCDGGSTSYNDPTYITACACYGNSYSDKPRTEHPGYCPIDDKLYCGGGWAVTFQGGNGTRSSADCYFDGTPLYNDGRGSVGKMYAYSGNTFTLRTDTDMVAPTGYGCGGGYFDSNYLTIEGTYAASYQEAKLGTSPKIQPGPGVIIFSY